MKAIVIGCPGSGKTTFANKLSDKTKTELFYLDKDFSSKFMKEMVLVAEAVKNAFGAEKINYECRGQGDAHLHWHISPRRAGDIGEYGNNGKGPIWWYPMHLMYDDSNRPTKNELSDNLNKIKVWIPRLF